MTLTVRRAVLLGFSAAIAVFAYATFSVWQSIHRMEHKASLLPVALETQRRVMVLQHHMQTSGLLEYNPTVEGKGKGSPRMRQALVDLAADIGALDQHTRDIPRQQVLIHKIDELMSNPPSDLGHQLNIGFLAIANEATRCHEELRADVRRYGKLAARDALLAGAAILLIAIFTGLYVKRRLHNEAQRSKLKGKNEITCKILDLSPKAVLFVLRDGTISHANTAAEKLYQLTRSELVGMDIRDILPGELLDYCKTNMIDHVMAPCSPRIISDTPLKLKNKSGDEIFIDFHVRMIEIDGDLIAVATVSDISLQIADRNALVAANASKSEALERMTLVTEAAELGCWFRDLHNDIYHVDDRYLEILGEKREEFDGSPQGFLERIHPEDKEAVHAMMQDIRKKDGKRIDCEYRIRHHDGHWVWVNCVARCVRSNAEGNCLAIAVTHRDISEVVHAREDLEQQRRLLSSLSGNIPGVLHRLVAHADGRRNFRYVGEKSEAVLGVEAVRFNLDDLSSKMLSNDAKELIESIEYCISEGLDIDREFKIHLDQGRVRWIRMNSSMVSGSKGAGTWDGVFMDVTDEVRQREALEKARAEADAANSAKSTFLASISHELRTPLTSILATIQLIEDTQLNCQQRELLDIQRSAGETLMSVISDVLDLSKIEKGKLNLDFEVVDTEKLVTRTLEIVRPQADAKSLDLKYVFPSEVSRYVIGDKTRLHQVLLNFVNNAVKFTERGSVVVKADEIESDELSHYFRFSVTDTGAGFDTSVTQQMFEPFQQFGDVDANTQGTGLGLSICSKLVNMMNGHIGVTSKLGVTIQVPPTWAGTMKSTGYKIHPRLYFAKVAVFS